MLSLVIRTVLVALLSLCISGSLSQARATTGYPQVIFIFDASGSMWGDAGGQSKIEAARGVMARIVPGLPAEVKVGLAAYGHRRKGDCNDIQVLVPPGSDDRAGLIATINQLTPKGKTPIAATISRVADSIRSFEDETTIVLISDGEETCSDSPCEIVRGLKESGIKFVLHVVGFGVNAQQKEQLQCLADAGGGDYFSADNAITLLSAMETVKKEVAQKVEQAKTVTKRAKTSLGKLHIAMPRDSTPCLATIKIIRKKDGKVVKTIKSPKADSIHPLIQSEYELIAGYANSNFRPDSEVSLGIFTIKGGEITELRFGSLAINISDQLKKIPAGAVMISSDNNPDFHFATVNTGNKWYFYRTKPLPPGIYSFAVHYKGNYLYHTSDKPFVLASGIRVVAGRQSVITINTGIKVKKANGADAVAWELIPEKQEKPLLRVPRASNGSYPLWKPYAIPPGTYDLIMFIKGMDEPLPVGEGLTIRQGELLEFDPGI